MATDYYHWTEIAGKPILIKIVVSANPRCYSEQDFSRLRFGYPVPKDARYIFITTNEEMAEENMDLEELAKYWESRVKEALS